MLNTFPMSESMMNVTTGLEIKLLELLIAKKYRIIRKIGSGSFGDIYHAINVTTGEVRNFFIFYLYLRGLISFNIEN